MTERPLSFCMVTTFYPPHHFGGDAMYVQRLSAELTRRGHDVTVVYPPDAYRALGGGAEHHEPEESAVNVVRLEGWLGTVAPTLTYLTGRPALRAGQLRAVLESKRFDVVHFHNVSLVGGPGVLALGSGIKLYTTHEHWLVCPMHVLWKNNNRPCERPQCLRCTFAFRRPPQLWRYGSLLERSAAHVDLFLSPSRFTIRMHRDRGFDFPTYHLPHFIPTTRSAVPHRRARPYFLVVGRLERLKGIQTLIDAFRGYDSADLLVVGDGTYAEELRRQASGLRNVELLGRRPYGELESLYAGAVAVLQPSVGYETFGMTVVEGFSQGTPAIVRDLGALPEAIEDSGGGFTYRTNDELIESMETLRADAGLRADLGERGRRAWLERWSVQPHMEAYFEAISEARLMSRRRAQ